MAVIPQFLIQSPLNPRSLRDIKPPLEFTNSLLPYYLIGVFFVAVAVGAIWMYQRKRSHSKSHTIAEEVIARPPHEIAFEKLRTLESSSCDMETYHKQISYVIREYIALRFQIPALELTTTGILQWMTRKQIDDLYVKRIHNFFLKCDLVKFAAHQVKSSEADARMVDALWFVEETK